MSLCALDSGGAPTLYRFVQRWAGSLALQTLSFSACYNWSRLKGTSGRVPVIYGRPPGCTFHHRKATSLFTLFCALLHQSEPHPPYCLALAHSLRVYPGWHHEHFFPFRNSLRPSMARHTSHFALVCSTPFALGDARAVLQFHLCLLPCYRHRLKGRSACP